MKNSVRYVRVAEPEHPGRLAGFVDVYKEAFGGPPYFEQYTADEVEQHVWRSHISDGVVILALDDEEVVGFGCAMPVLKSPQDVREFLVGQWPKENLPLSLAWYMSELGVRMTHRGRKIAYGLTLQRFEHIDSVGGKTYVMRTAALGSNSLHLYRKIGATELQNLQDVTSTDQVLNYQSQSTQRVYLYGLCLEAKTRIQAITAC